MAKRKTKSTGAREYYYYPDLQCVYGCDPKKDPVVIESRCVCAACNSFEYYHRKLRHGAAYWVEREYKNERTRRRIERMRGGKVRRLRAVG